MKLKLSRRNLSILTHLCVWIVFMGLPAIFSPNISEFRDRLVTQPPESSRLWIGMSINLILIIWFYVNYAFLLPRFFLRGRTLGYFIGVIVVFILYWNYIALVRTTVIEKYDLKADVISATHITRVISTVFFVLMWGASSGVRLGQEWMRAENQRRETETVRLQAELSQLKNQINPHFLFNTLNGIYALTLAKSEQAPKTVLKLSNLLRYVLTESEKDLVDLRSDLAQLHDFIELHRLRLSEETKVLFVEEISPGNYEIAPLLLLHFVENAFKYGVSNRQASTITILIKESKGTLHFFCENNIFFNDNSTQIGLANTRRRLELLYPEKHRLEITETAERYMVSLEIQLT